MNLIRLACGRQIHGSPHIVNIRANRHAMMCDDCQEDTHVPVVVISLLHDRCAVSWSNHPSVADEARRQRFTDVLDRDYVLAKPAISELIRATRRRWMPICIMDAFEEIFCSE
jgi:ribosome-binding protein aMBF1 (putative translation factor)